MTGVSWGSERRVYGIVASKRGRPMEAAHLVPKQRLQQVKGSTAIADS
jgi:hypothetical protein